MRVTVKFCGTINGCEAYVGASFGGESRDFNEGFGYGYGSGSAWGFGGGYGDQHEGMGVGSGCGEGNEFREEYVC